MEVSSLPRFVVLSPLCWSVLLVLSCWFSDLLSHYVSYLMIFVTASLPLCLNLDLFEVLGYLPSLHLVSFEIFEICVVL